MLMLVVLDRIMVRSPYRPGPLVYTLNRYQQPYLVFR